MLSCYVTLPCIFYVICSHFTYSSCNNLISVISRVLIYSYLNFCSLTSPTSCNSPRKCTPVKGKVKQKAGYQCFIQNSEADLEGARGVRPSLFFWNHFFLAISLKNYMSLLKLNWSLIMHFWHTFEFWIIGGVGRCNNY